jgi:hypothetical protein
MDTFKDVKEAGLFSRCRRLGQSHKEVCHGQSVYDTQQYCTRGDRTSGPRQRLSIIYTTKTQYNSGSYVQHLL